MLVSNNSNMKFGIVRDTEINEPQLVNLPSTH